MYLLSKHKVKHAFDSMRHSIILVSVPNAWRRKKMHGEERVKRRERRRENAERERGGAKELKICGNMVGHVCLANMSE
jgi:hypothetical protein